MASKVDRASGFSFELAVTLIALRGVVDFSNSLCLPIETNFTSIPNSPREALGKCRGDAGNPNHQKQDPIAYNNQSYFGGSGCQTPLFEYVM